MSQSGPGETVAARAVGRFSPWLDSLGLTIVSASDASWDHGESTVVRLEVESDRVVYLKTDMSRRKFDQEQRAYADWCVELPNVPTLHSSTVDPGPALLIEGAPGAPLLTLTLERSEERSAYEKAGRFLAAMHGLPLEDRDALPIPEAWLRRATTWAARAKRHLDTSTIQRVVDLAAAPWPGAVPSRVPCHRDFTARNWLVSGDHFTVIDFEHSRSDWQLVDHERVLASIPEGRDDLAEAFRSGYGRDLNDAEHEQMRRVTAVAAMAQVAWAVEHRDTDFEERGRAVLNRVFSSPR